MESAKYTVGNNITSEQAIRIREAAKHPVVYTKDCPELTDEQLAEFQPVNFTTWEERYQAMIEAGVITEKEPIPATVGK